jgi:hypothetical protein
MNNKEKYEKIKQEIRQTGGRCNHGSMLIFGKNGSVWNFNVDEEKLLNDVDNYHTVISKIVGTEVNLVGLSKVPDVSIKEIAGVKLAMGIDYPGCIVTAIGGEDKFVKFENLVKLLIEDDKIWVDIFINSKMEEHWNDAGYSKHRTIESMFNEWQLYQKLTKIRIENGIQEPEVVPFLFYHDYLEVDVSAESWQHLFNLIAKHNLKLNGNEITITANQIELKINIDMMANLMHSTDSNNKQISSSVISCDLPKHILTMITYPSEKWFTENNYCSVEDWESWLPFAIEECIVDEFTWTVNPQDSNGFKSAIDKIIAMLTRFNDEKFLSEITTKATVAIATRLWQEQEWPDLHIEDSYTMQDYRNEKALFVKKISDLLKGGI